MSLPARLEAIREEITAYAEAYGLDFFPVVFELVDLEQMNEVASYGGFPTRYSHWRFGMEYEELDRGSTYGLQRIYELVLNTNPCYAYLLRGNSLVDQKMVMAHVLAHTDFFKNNHWFSHTNRKMLDEMANHAVRVRRYMDRHGQDLVEDFIDSCLSLENLIDVHALFVGRGGGGAEVRESEEPEGGCDGIHRLRSKEYMDPYINPDEFLEAQRRRLEQERARHGMIPPRPVKDVLGFLLEYAPLDTWERDILAMVREEALYFAPQRQTKIMNEGWATYWHSRIMTERALGDSEVVDYAERHAGTLGGPPGVINPYKLGVEIFRDIEIRWNRGAFGKEYDECESMKERVAWDRGTGEGLAQIFEVRRVHNDITFVETFLTQDFCERHRLFTYAYDEEEEVYRIRSRKFAAIKERLLFSLTNIGQPIIMVEDANHHNRGELLLRHRHEGFDLRLDYARDTLARLHRLWHRPVNLITVIGKKEKILGFDGESWHEDETGSGGSVDAEPAAA